MKNPPEYRRYRLGALVAYITATLFICLCIFFSVARGARLRMGIPPAAAPAASVDQAALQGCLRELETLYGELNDRLDAALASWPARRSSVEWEEWSPAWRQRLVETGARCRLEQGDVPNARELRVVYRRLSHLHRHYTTLAVQFSKEIGPHSDTLHQAMERARTSLGLPATTR